VAKAHFRMEGPPGQNIVKSGAERLGAGLIVTGSRGLSRIRRALMGSVSDSVRRTANPCPCTVMKVSPA
jgi:nucleotide-binding universal stress UspA family protein